MFIFCERGIKGGWGLSEKSLCHILSGFKIILENVDSILTFFNMKT